MPSREMRNIQYGRNKETLSDLYTLEKQRYDWVVTVAFYTALHLVEKHLPLKARKHEERNKIVINEIKFGNDVADAFRALFNASIISRYHCQPITDRRARDALLNLKTIEDNLP